MGPLKHQLLSTPPPLMQAAWHLQACLAPRDSAPDQAGEEGPG